MTPETETREERPKDVRGKPVQSGRWYWATNRLGQIVGTGKFLAAIGSGEWAFYINGAGYRPDTFTYEKAVPPGTEVLADIKRREREEPRHA
jgi:hypothetical protein